MAAVTHITGCFVDEFSTSPDRLEELAGEVLVVNFGVEFPLQVDCKGDDSH